MQAPTAVVAANESIAANMEKFESNNLPYLPVLKNKRLIGLISKSQVLAQYRDELMRNNRFF